MSKRFERNLIIVISMFILILFILLLRFIIFNGVFQPYLKLNGHDITLQINEEYIEKGILVKDKFKKINENINIKSNLDTTKIGKYKVIYEYKNKNIERNIEVVDTIKPKLKLNNEDHIIIYQNEEYIEYGVLIEDNSKIDLTHNLSILSDIDTSKIGIYKVIYKVEDQSYNENSIERIVEVVENPMNKELHYHYDHLDNNKYSWWFKKASDHERKPSTYDINIMNKYNAYYIGNDEKVIYLTFDEGGSDKTYIKEITNILNNHDVKASYFLTRNYIFKEKDFMNELVNNGHEIGNHTRSHYDMTTLANELNLNKFISEIMDTQKTIYEVTKKMPPLIFRFPKGEFSERSLAIVNDLGYSCYFWSHAYNDYSGDISKEEAYNTLIGHLHNGAIYLIHPSNSGNYDAMNDFILEAKKLGYTFDLVSNIKKD